MQGNLKSLHLLLIIICFTLVSCTTTTITSVWKDESYKGQIQNVFVIGLFQRETNRRIYEDEFVKQLSAQGVNAIASYKELRSDKLLDKKVIMSKMEELNMEVVFITNIVDKERKEMYGKTWYNDYSYHYPTRYKISTMRYLDYDYHVETELYDVRSDGLIWSALSETVVMEKAIVQSDRNIINALINAMVKKLSDDGLVKKLSDDGLVKQY
jgi:hypothetical protein